MSSLGTRASLLFLAGVLTTGLGFYGVLVSFTRSWLMDELDDRMRAVGSASSERLRVPLAFLDRGELAASLDDLLAESDVIGAAIHDARGGPILARAGRDSSWITRSWRAPAAGRLEAEGEGLVVASSPLPDRSDLLEYMIPIRGEAGQAAEADEATEMFGLSKAAHGPGGPAADRSLGWLRIVVSTQRVERLVGTAARAGVAVLIAAFVLALLAALFLMRLVVRPLREAGELAQEIADGNLARRLPVRGRDELGSLAASLNRMADALDLARRQTALEAAHLRDSTRAVIGVARQARRVSDPERAFEIVASHARSLVGCELVALAVPESAGASLHIEYLDPASGPGPFPLGFVVAADEMLAGEGEVRTGRRIDLSEARSLANALAVSGVVEAFTVALPRPDGPPSVLLLAAREPGRFEDWHLDVIDALSSHLSAALHTAQLRARLEGAFAELERTRDSLVRAQNLRMASEIASGAAHDFNNVLSAILGRAQLLRRQHEAGSLAGPALVRSLEVMEAAARDGSDTVRRLREFGRGGESAMVEVVDLANALHDAVEFTRVRWEDEAQAQGKSIQVLMDIEAGVCVLARLSEIREVFTNLLLNAVDALPQGGTIRITLHAASDHAVVMVGDDGEGMTTEVQARIFEPFYTTKGARGTGLGLSVVYGIVMRARGSIDVESAPGQGTRFRLSFPRADAAAADGSPSPSGAFAPPTQALRILVVDDEDAVREVLVDILHALGHHAESSAAPVEVAATFVPGRYDLVLTDVGMPEMNGWTLARVIHGCDPQVMIALVTGWGEEIALEDVREAGADMVIAKPFTIEDLTRVCDEARSRRQSRLAA
jgi:signal transduction histidine kinase/ActR/RegA family two-component response regulator